MGGKNYGVTDDLKDIMCLWIGKNSIPMSMLSARLLEFGSGMGPKGSCVGCLNTAWHYENVQKL